MQNVKTNHRPSIKRPIRFLRVKTAIILAALALSTAACQSLGPDLHSAEGQRLNNQMLGFIQQSQSFVAEPTPTYTKGAPYFQRQPSSQQPQYSNQIQYQPRNQQEDAMQQYQFYSDFYGQ